MDGVLTAHGILAPAVCLLLDLQREGFIVELTPDDALTIAPRSRLTPERMRTIAASKDALKTLLRDDAGLIARRQAFEQQLASTPAPRLPAFVFTPGIAYTKGFCFSCGEPMPQWIFGRCWRCALAWRLACRLVISPDLAAALNSARVVA